MKELIIGRESEQEVLREAYESNVSDSINQAILSGTA